MFFLIFFSSEIDVGRHQTVFGGGYKNIFHISFIFFLQLGNCSGGRVECESAKKSFHAALKLMRALTINKGLFWA